MATATAEGRSRSVDRYGRRQTRAPTASDAHPLLERAAPAPVAVPVAPLPLSSVTPPQGNAGTVAPRGDGISGIAAPPTLAEDAQRQGHVDTLAPLGEEAEVETTNSDVDSDPLNRATEITGFATKNRETE